jgi:hypothetical protein
MISADLAFFPSASRCRPKAGTILVRFNPIRKKEISDREFRETVSQLVTVYKTAICTSPTRGYNMARTMSEKSADLVAYDSLN